MTQPDTKKSARPLLNFLMLVAFLLNVVTGIIKFPELQRYFLFVYNYISSAKLSWVHDFSGLALIGLVIFHLVINKKGLLVWPMEILNKFHFPESKDKKKLFVFILFIVALLVVFSLLSYRRQPTTLPVVEIQNYQGEKLGSLNDFRENSIKGPQYIDKNSYQLEISGLVSAPAMYSYADILQLPAYQKVVTLDCVEGWSVKALWEGILVKDLLKNMAIKPEAKTIIFYAADGYSTSFPLDYVLNNDIIMADKINGVVLPPERGFPFQLVAEQKWGYKWIKWITKIELSSDTNYKGFWESRGYNNNGDLKDSQYAQ